MDIVMEEEGVQDISRVVGLSLGCWVALSSIASIDEVSWMDG